MSAGSWGTAGLTCQTCDCIVRLNRSLLPELSVNANSSYMRKVAGRWPWTPGFVRRELGWRRPRGRSTRFMAGTIRRILQTVSQYGKGTVLETNSWWPLGVSAVDGQDNAPPGVCAHWLIDWCGWRWITCINGSAKTPPYPQYTLCPYLSLNDFVQQSSQGIRQFHP